MYHINDSITLEVLVNKRKRRTNTAIPLISEPTLAAVAEALGTVFDAVSMM